MKRLNCTFCGYIHEGAEPPDKCPNCASPKEIFIEVPKDFENIHIPYAQKMTYLDHSKVNPFFGSMVSLAPYIYCLPPSQRKPLHKHPTTDELFFILKGKFKFKVGDKEIIAVQGDVVQGRMNVPHTFQNISDEHGSFLSVKGPKPVDLVVLEDQK
jgi:mannose-6-phosphate isomerase-like protein (cupin superfamily)